MELRRATKAGWIIAGAVGMMIVAGCGSAADEVKRTYVPRSDDELALVAKGLGRDPAAFDGLTVATMDGTYIVGRDIRPGDYRATRPADGIDPTSCEWSVRSADGVVVSDSGPGPLPDRVVDGLQRGQTFVTENCGLWESTR